MVMGGSPVAHEVVCGGRPGAHYDGYYVSAVAGEAADWSVVSEYGDVRLDWVVLCHGDSAVDFVLCDGFRGAAGVVVVSESI